MSCLRPRGQFLRGRGQMPLGRGRGRIIWPRGHTGLEALTSLLRSLFHFRWYYKIRLDMIYCHSPEGATALRNNATVLAEFALSDNNQLLLLLLLLIWCRTVQILFIGDSTNRGMTHYVTERLNGSLTEWDRTHDARVYDNINSRQTVLSFAYYPQFWMPPGQRPLFDASLLQLLKMYAFTSAQISTLKRRYAA